MIIKILYIKIPNGVDNNTIWCYNNCEIEMVHPKHLTKKWVPYLSTTTYYFSFLISNMLQRYSNKLRNSEPCNKLQIVNPWLTNSSR